MKTAVDRLSPNPTREKPMPEIRCYRCNLIHLVENTYNHMGREAALHHEDIIRGVFICGNCEAHNAFEITGDVITQLPGSSVQPKWVASASMDAKEMLQEALHCLYGGSYRGAVAMCRSAVEEALDDKNAKGHDLDSKIAYAHKGPKNQHGILGDEEVARAHGARLSGRNVLHRMAKASFSDALLAIAATTDLVNHIGQQPAMPRGKDSNAPSP